MKWIKRADGLDICENCQIEKFVIEDVYFEKRCVTEEGKKIIEINLNPYGTKPIIQINVSHDQPVIIDKLFGATTAEQVRIYMNLDTCEWVIERERIDKDKDGNDICTWEKKISWFCQEGITFNEKPPKD